MGLSGRILAAQNQVLERIATGAPMDEVLELLTTSCEALTPEVLCSVLLLTDDRRLIHGSAPSLPAAYLHAIDGMTIGPGKGSCGASAYSGERVIVEDVFTHPYWADYHELAALAGVRACWSQPIRSSRGGVLGTFAMYYREPRAPGPDDLALIDSFAHLAEVGIERARIEAELERHQHHLEQLVEERTAELRQALADVKVLRGMLPICAWCKRVRDDRGFWAEIEAYIAQHSNAVFTHGICPHCMEELHPEPTPPLVRP